MFEQERTPRVPRHCSPGEAEGQSWPGLAGPYFKPYCFWFVDLENLHKNHSRTHVLTQ